MYPSEYSRHHSKTPRTSNTERFRIAADLFDHTRELIEVLHETRAPDISEYYFSFYEHGLTQVQPPEAAQELANYIDHSLDEIQIDIGKESFEATSGVTFRFVFDMDDDDKTVVLSSTWPKFHQTGHDPVTVSANSPDLETSFRVPEIPASEINRCLASLCYPSTTGDYSQFDTLDFTSRENYSALVDLFQKHSQHYSGVVTYELNSEENPSMTGLLCYTDDNGETVHTYLRQLSRSDVLITDDGSLILEEAASSTELDTTTGASVSFHEESSTSGRKNIAPAQQDYENVCEFLRHHLEHLPQLSTESIEAIDDNDLPPSNT